MRVPLSHADLRPKYGFYRIAKKLQRNWPGTAPLPQASTHEILARALGYHDLHDLQKSGDSHSRSSVVPTLDEVRDSIVMSVVAFCRSRNINDLTRTATERLVRLLPLHELSAFQPPSSKQMAGSHEERVLLVSRYLSRLAKEDNCDKLRATMGHRGVWSTSEYLCLQAPDRAK